MSGFQEMRFWSPTLGCDAARLSMTDERGSEYFMIVPREAGARWREKRAEAVEVIERAIHDGVEPGEVVR